MADGKAEVFSELTNQHDALLQKAEQIRKQEQMESDQMEQLSLEVEALKVEESRLPAVIDESRKVLDVHRAKKDEKSSRTTALVLSLVCRQRPSS